MKYKVRAHITAKAAARLLISDELDLNAVWNDDEVEQIFEQLRALPVREILHIVDTNPYGEVAEVQMIPQFGRVDTLLHVPDYFREQGVKADCAQMGFYLKKDPQASLVSNVKFGENHGKTVAMLGLMTVENGHFGPSALTYGFCELDELQRREVVRKLLFRLPLVQMILKGAVAGEVNGCSFMSLLAESTRYRRSQCVKGILAELKELPDEDLQRRLGCVYWKACEGETYAITEI